MRRLFNPLLHKCPRHPSKDYWERSPSAEEIRNEEPGAVRHLQRGVPYGEQPREHEIQYPKQNHIPFFIKDSVQVLKSK